MTSGQSVARDMFVVAALATGFLYFVVFSGMMPEGRPVRLEPVRDVQPPALKFAAAGIHNFAVALEADGEIIGAADCCRNDGSLRAVELRPNILPSAFVLQYAPEDLLGRRTRLYRYRFKMPETDASVTRMEFRLGLQNNFSDSDILASPCVQSAEGSECLPFQRVP